MAYVVNSQCILTCLSCINVIVNRNDLLTKNNQIMHDFIFIRSVNANTCRSECLNKKIDVMKPIKRRLTLKGRETDDVGLNSLRGKY